MAEIVGSVTLTPTHGLRSTAGVSDRRVAFPLYPELQPLDLSGPFEVFATANHVLDFLGRDEPRYELIIAAEAAGPVRSESGMTLHADVAFVDVAGPLHTIVVPGGFGARDEQPALIEWLTETAPQAERIATVCTGTFLAAAAGLCDGRRVTTHWMWAGALAETYPAATVDPDPIYINDGNLWTSAGVTSGIDLALALVEEDCGAEVARNVARLLVVYLHRPGGQSQFAAPVWSKPAEGAPIKDACDIIHAELAGDLSVDALAARVGMSSRHFSRCFRSEVGETVARHVERLRVEAARQILEKESVGMDSVAQRCGFGTAETLRRAFHRRLSISPDAYRRQFRTTVFSNS